MLKLFWEIQIQIQIQVGVASHERLHIAWLSIACQEHACLVQVALVRNTPSLQGKGQFAKAQNAPWQIDLYLVKMGIPWLVQGAKNRKSPLGTMP